MLSSRLTFTLRCFASQFINISSFTPSNCRGASTKEIAANEATVLEDAEYEQELKAREEAIERKRNKSELHAPDFNVQNNRVPYEKPQFEFHESKRYRRRMYGRYGEASSVDPSILWPDKKELEAMREYEEAAQPFTLQQLMRKNQEKNALAVEARRKEEAEVLEKVARVNNEIIAFHKRVALEKQKALALLERKNKLIEQVRKEYGYKLDPRDEKFKEALEKLQKEERKKAQAEKKKKIEEKKLAAQSQTSNRQTEEVAEEQ